MTSALVLPKTAKEAQALLRQAGLPELNPSLIAEIVQKEGDSFKAAIAQAAQGEACEEATKRYLAQVITACVPATRIVLDRLGLGGVPVASLIELSKTEGRTFGQAIRMLNNAEFNADNAHARQYLQRIVAPLVETPPSYGADPSFSNATSARVAPSPAATRAAEPPAQYSDPVQPDYPVEPTASSRAPTAPSYPAPTRGSSSPSTAPTSATAAPSRHAPSQHPESRRAPAEVRPFPQRQDRNANDNRDTSAPSGEGNENTDRKFSSVHLYGGKAAFCFSPDETRKGTSPTVRVETAKASGPRQYDWSTKVSFQLTVSELPLVFGVLYGFMPRVELNGHGAENEKSMSIEDQGGKFFFSMRVRGGTVYAIPSPAKDAFPIMTMLLEQMQKNAPGLPTAQILQIAKRVCDMYQMSDPAPVQRAANG